MSSRMQIHVCRECGSRKKTPKSKKRPQSSKKQHIKLNYVYGKHGYDAVKLYAEEVAIKLNRRPKAYKKFLAVLSDVQKAETNKVDVIVRLVQILDGYPDLILGFNAFLPDEYTIEFQGPNIVIRVYESESPDADLVTYPAEPAPGQPVFHPTGSMNQTYTRLSDDKDTLEYIKRVKAIYRNAPDVYAKFQTILGDFHNRKVNEFDTVHSIVALFGKHPELVFGFNAFLPPGYMISRQGENAYSLQYAQDGFSNSMCIMLDDDF